MKFVRSTVEYTLASAVILLLLLDAGVFAYSAKSASASSSNSPLDNEHEHTSTSTHTTHTSSKDSTSTHTTHSSSEQSTSTQSQSDENDNEGNDQQGENEGGSLHFTLVAASSSSSSNEDGHEGHENGDRGQATITINGNALNIEISVKKTSPSTTFSVILVATPIQQSTTMTTSTSTIFSTTISSTSSVTSSSSSTVSCTGSIGTLVTDKEGDAEAELSTTLASGTYALGLALCSNNAAALISHPEAIKATVPPPSDEDEHEKTTSTSTTKTIFSTSMTSTTVFSTSTKSSSEIEDNHGDQVNAVTKTGEDDDAIRSAISGKTIPAVISVFNTETTVSQLDSRFSVAASKLTSNGLLISISAQNVTGSRVLLVNLTGSQWSTASLQSMKVTLDGSPISQAASISQVLNSNPTDPARYVIMLTSSGLQLLVSIPHFSLHTIQLIPTMAPTTGSGLSSVDMALSAGVIAVLGALSVVVYSKRTRARLS